VILRASSAALVVASLLAACAAVPPPPSPATPEGIAARSPDERLEGDFRRRALALMQERRWAEAEVQWKLLLLLRPGTGEYAGQLEATRRAIAEVAAEANAHAAAARRRGDLDTATTQYLRALAADRDNAVAAAGLREIELERNRRAYLHRPPRSVGANGAVRTGAASAMEPEYSERHRPPSDAAASHAPR
jgi:hypothetical protein